MPDHILDTPIMPTGSGIADLEIARELDAVMEADTDPDADPDALTPTEAPIASGQRESEAHPS